MAVVNGHVEVLRWARQNGCPWTAYTRDEAAERVGCADDSGNLLVPGPARGAGALRRQGQPLQGPASPAQPHDEPQLRQQWPPTPFRAPLHRGYTQRGVPRTSSSSRELAAVGHVHVLEVLVPRQLPELVPAVERQARAVHGHGPPARPPVQQVPVPPLLLVGPVQRECQSPASPPRGRSNGRRLPSALRRTGADADGRRT